MEARSNNNIADQAIRNFADLMINKIEEVSANPEKPWFSTVGKGLPQNYSARIYHGINAFLLYLLCEKKEYQTPVFMTFKQAQDEGLSVRKGEKSFPVVYWNFSIKDISGKNISLDYYNTLSKEQKSDYTVIPYLKPYNVFNVEQTNLQQIAPEKWEALKSKFNIRVLNDEKNMLACPPIDLMLKEQAWLCPIRHDSNKAYYSFVEDTIHLPQKGQFVNGESYYSVMLHEMTHSTGTKDRLNREKPTKFGDSKYAKEELVAELASALCCRSMGIVSCIREENAMYLKNWLAALKEEPKFIISILSDVGKASNMINEVVNSLEKTSEMNVELIEAANKKDFTKVLELKDQGYIPSQEVLNFLVQSGIQESSLIAVQKIFGINDYSCSPHIQLAAASCINNSDVLNQSVDTMMFN